MWDAPKDMAFASLGAFIAMSITMMIQKGFFEERKLSLEVKHDKPPGEEEISRLLNQQKENNSLRSFLLKIRYFLI